MTVATPSAIHTFLESTNDEDTEAFLGCFSDDAVLDDWGRVFHGPAEIASWNETDNIGRHSRFDVVEVAQGDGDDRFVVTVDVTGDGYNGLGTMTFTVSGERIRSLVIS